MATICRREPDAAATLFRVQTRYSILYLSRVIPASAHYSVHPLPPPSPCRRAADTVPLVTDPESRRRYVRQVTPFGSVNVSLDRSLRGVWRRHRRRALFALSSSISHRPTSFIRARFSGSRCGPSHSHHTTPRHLWLTARN